MRMATDWFRERAARFRERQSRLPSDLWVKCPKCLEAVLKSELRQTQKVCPKCDHHMALTAQERLEITLDPGTWRPFTGLAQTADPLSFPEYREKLQSSEEKTGLDEAFIAGEGAIEGEPIAVGVVEFGFMGGSMASAFGERFVRMVEYAAEKKLVAITFAASGGARMQEGVLSLMQMAKTAGAIAALEDKPTLYVSVITDPTFAGVFASFVSLGDVIISEPRARVGFAGDRPIEQNLKVKLSPHIHTAEFQQEHGMIDLVLPRTQIRPALARLCKIWSAERNSLAGSGAEAHPHA
jgi:acetyl-CoA carboxylase carboxyl transferase subunit beta